MVYRHQVPPTQRKTGKKLTLFLAVSTLMMTSSCALLTRNGEDSLSDDAVRQYVDEWRQIKPSIDRLALLEGDLSVLLAEVSKMSDVTQTPGLALTDDIIEPPAGGVAMPVTEPVQALDITHANPEPNTTTTENDAAANTDAVPPTAPAEQADLADETAGPGLSESAAATSSCPVQYADNLRKSLALTYFPRTQPATSNAGSLHQVDQHLPLLLSANLKTRHGIQVQSQIPGTLYSARHADEYPAAAQAKAIARQHNSQFLITGEIHDMSLVSPELAYAQGPYNNLVKSVTNLINRNGLNTQARVFNFQLQVRDGFTGQLIFDETYQTIGNWDAVQPGNIGFGSARFWQTDYGQKVQHLVALASDKLATALACQPFTAHADASTHPRQIVVHGGANNGFKAGDTLAVYRVMQHPITGQYLRYHSSMVSTDTNVSLVSVYPSHSIARSDQDLPQTGSFLVMEH